MNQFFKILSKIHLYLAIIREITTYGHHFHMASYSSLPYFGGQSNCEDVSFKGDSFELRNSRYVKIQVYFFSLSVLSRTKIHNILNLLPRSRLVSKRIGRIISHDP